MPETVGVNEFTEGFKAVHDEFAKRLDEYKRDMQAHHDALMQVIRQEYAAKAEALEDFYRERYETIVKEFDARMELVAELVTSLSKPETKEIVYDQFNRPQVIKIKRE